MAKVQRNKTVAIELGKASGIFNLGIEATELSNYRGALKEFRLAKEVIFLAAEACPNSIRIKYLNEVQHNLSILIRLLKQAIPGTGTEKLGFVLTVEVRDR